MRIVVCGDALFSSRNLVNRLDKRLVNMLLNADAVFANAEFCVPKRTTPPAAGVYVISSAPPEILDEFVDLNIKLISFTNNHTGDHGPQGVLDTMEAARERGLIHCGIGHNLENARQARFLDTAKGRVSVVAANSTWSEKSHGSMESADLIARPGSCPLRWGRTYVLPDKEFEQLKQIAQVLGTEASMLEVSRVESWPLPGPDTFKFGSPMEGNLQIERGDRAYVRTYVDENDEKAVLKSIRDAAKRSDVVIASLHTHEGINENWYSPQPPTFVEEFARKAIDAGATTVVGQGAHMARGVEIYKGRPIFYNLGSLFMEGDWKLSRITPEMYERKGLSTDSRPSDLFAGRTKDKDGNWIGFYAERRISKNFLVIMDKEGDHLDYKLLPLDLDLQREYGRERGMPAIASAEVGAEITSDLTKMSERYGTQFFYDKEDGTITFKSYSG